MELRFEEVHRGLHEVLRVDELLRGGVDGDQAVHGAVQMPDDFNELLCFAATVGGEEELVGGGSPFGDDGGDVAHTLLHSCFRERLVSCLFLLWR